MSCSRNSPNRNFPNAPPALWLFSALAIMAVMSRSIVALLDKKLPKLITQSKSRSWLYQLHCMGVVYHAGKDAAEERRQHTASQLQQPHPVVLWADDLNRRCQTTNFAQFHPESWSVNRVKRLGEINADGIHFELLLFTLLLQLTNRERLWFWT